MNIVKKNKLHNLSMRDWTVTGACGGKYPGADPVFFSDRQRVGVATALAVKIYQLSTRQMIAKINANCTACTQLLLSRSEEHFILVHGKGSVQRVRVSANEVETLETDGFKVHRLLSEAEDNDMRFNALVVSAQGYFEAGALDLTTGKFDSVFVSQMQPANGGFAAWSASSQYVAIGSSRSNEIELVNMETQEAQTLRGAGRSAATCVAVSNAGVVAMGTASGVIDVIYPEKGWIRALKWHMEPVTALCFTLDDEYLLSGGHERVLVFWQMVTNEQQFLPRLQAEITSICANSKSTLYGITLGSAQLVVLNAADLLSKLNVAGVRAENVKLPPDPKSARRKRRNKDLDNWASSDYTTPLEALPGTRTVCLRSSKTQLQFFNLSRDEQELVLNVAPTLDTGKVRREREIEDPDVNVYKFSPDGRYMVTAETSKTPPGLLSSQETHVNLKFWQLLDGKWVLCTRIESPHGVGTPIRDIGFLPDGVLSAAADGSLRLWRVREQNRAQLDAFVLKRSLPGFATNTRAVSLAISSDHTVLALGHELNIYIVDPGTFQVRCQLPNLAGSPIRRLLFTTSNLVIMAKMRLVVYDLVNMCEKWSIALKVPSNGGRLIAVDEQVIALATNFWDGYKVRSLVLNFSAESSVPRDVCRHSHAVSSVTSIPGTQSFCFIDARGVLSTLAGPAQQQQQQQQTEQPTLVSTLTALYAKQSEDHVVEMEGDGKRSLDVNAMSRVLDSGVNLEDLFEKVLKLVS